MPIIFCLTRVIILLAGCAKFRLDHDGLQHAWPNRVSTAATAKGEVSLELLERKPLRPDPGNMPPKLLLDYRLSLSALRNVPRVRNSRVEAPHGSLGNGVFFEVSQQEG